MRSRNQVIRTQALFFGRVFVSSTVLLHIIYTELVVYSDKYHHCNVHVYTILSFISRHGTHVGKCFVYHLFDCVVPFNVHFVKQWLEGVMIAEKSELWGMFQNIDRSVFGKLWRADVCPTATATIRVHRRRG